MLPLILRRLAQLPIILLVIYTITLTLAWAVPGNPLEKAEGRQPPGEVVEAMKRQYNLHRFDAFYFSYLQSITGVRYVRTKWAEGTNGAHTANGAHGTNGANAADLANKDKHAASAPLPDVSSVPQYIFDMGPSLQYEDWRVNEIVGDALPVSISLGAMAMLIAIFVGVGAGVVGAIRPGSWADFATLSVALVGISMPSFVIGTAMVMVFGVWLGIAPVGGWGELRHYPLPALTLSLPFAAYIARLTRMGMVEHLKADFIRTARAKGLSEARVVLKHALKNAFLPVLSYLGPATAMAMTGSFVVERVFALPGLGQHFVNAVQNKDLFLIMGVVLVFSTMLIVLNLVVDVLYRWVDPRIE